MQYVGVVLSCTELSLLSHPVVAELLRLGADPNVCDHKGRSALAWALKRQDKADTAVVRALIWHGADVMQVKHAPEWVLILWLGRRRSQSACVTLLGIRKWRDSVLTGNVADMTRLIAQALWMMRESPVWSTTHTGNNNNKNMTKEE